MNSELAALLSAAIPLKRAYADIPAYPAHDDDIRLVADVLDKQILDTDDARVVRLEHGPRPDPWILQFLVQELELTPDDVYEMPAVLDYTTLRFMAELPIRELRYGTVCLNLWPGFAFAERIASRTEPVPLSLRLPTVKLLMRKVPWIV